MHSCSGSLQTMLRKVAVMKRRVVHVKGDLMCTLVLLVVFCVLLYTRQVVLSPGWSRPQWKLEIHGSTSPSRTLLGARGAKAGRGSPGLPSETQLPPCKLQSNSKLPHPKSRPKTKSKSRRRNATPTRIPAKVLPTMQPFDFQGYLRDKDNRKFNLLIDQPQKCHIRGTGEEEGGGGRRRQGSESDAAPYMLIAVKSTAADFHKRQVVRRTWGKEGRFQPGVSIRTVFLLGVPRNRSALPLWERLLSYESQTFRDILLWDFEDTFFNLTLKETHFLEWVNSSCPHVRFIFKGDADVYVNVENILEMLRDQKPEEDLFVGDIIIHAKPIRRRSSKYYVPEFMYGGLLYPDYAGGGGFVMSGHTARRLSSACQQVELFPIDDVFLGMCLQLIGVKPSRHQGFRTFGIPRPSAAPHLQTFDPCFYRELMVVHSLNVPQIWLMWNLLHDPNLSCHNRTGLNPQPFKWREMMMEEEDYTEKQVFLTH
ncbi:UDP-GlcNAc:betaGal beta-1,3-N-acetylglucosaminyltransferase 9 isoform X1 [Melanotaenia boesemani]|uniref:UDP-GlcNAc:betaGal beta-1,3-N-acetylglucosaminyltransferase 9 isoform X1 n=1 Tax=Melanotaenia boesemani TaxID=1250792 RepID=UPI001C03D124|nr:UDP-GlcNAc:betaGal beta-1,3-N-acetylglucosaminyltransferase 9 isoform X1 [Melanotaenia boesemani]XP_041852026.1 UDP-GlcNAc:betaGal beta-1,3-N-acetylglucosaminyltransferase 9 isoform X1 [Melanotaenia boesemani]XP_041852027.1 UDP-GlcNAc:betaGal beta-1,3-N-acetylglucosaminyltransferase 9 isoform X1 [Melanotaenia boesemani]